MANKTATIAGTKTGTSFEDGVLLASGVLTVTDADPGQSFMQSVSNALAKYGLWSVDADGAWNYLLDNSNASVQALGAGKTLSDSFTVTSLDGSATKTVTITIKGTNDIPVITGTDNGTVTEDKTLSASGTLTVTDPDTGESHTKAVSNQAAAHGSWSVDSNGHWLYKLNNADPAVQALTAGETLSDSFTVKSQDGSATQVITISINGTDDKAVITGETTGNVVEDGLLIATGSLVITDKDHDQSHSQAASGTAKYGSWSVDADGHWSYQLDNGNQAVQALGLGKTLTDTFTVVSEDGGTTKTITIKIAGSNDVPVISGTTDGHVAEGGVLKATGTLSVLDADSGQSHSAAVSNAVATYGSWSVDSNGHWTYQLDKYNAAVVALEIGHTLTDSFTVQSQDHTASQTITITITGNNHVPIVTGAVTGTVTEDVTTTANGSLTVTDVDAGQSHTQVVDNMASTYGSWSVDGNGHWSYQLDNAKVQALGVGQTATDSFVVTSQDGSTHQTVSITINGTNDAPTAPADIDQADNAILSDAAAGTSVGITAQATDVDSSTITYALADDAGGRFQIDPQSGVITVAPDAVLEAGTYTVKAVASDGQALSGSTDFTITVTEANHVPVLTPTASFAFVAAEIDGWGLWVAQDGGEPQRVSVFGSQPQSVTEVDGKIYFTTYDADHGNEIWVYDPVAQESRLAADVLPGSGDSNPTNLTAMDGKLYFTTTGGNPNHTLMVFDPATGTAGEAALNWPGIKPYDPQHLTVLDGKLYFSAYDNSHGYKLWAYDPGSRSVDLVDYPQLGTLQASPTVIAAVDGKLYLDMSGAFWIYNPADQSASQITLGGPGQLGSDPTYMTSVGGKVYFAATDNAHGTEIWVYDPAVGSGQLVADVAAGAAGSNPKFLTELDGNLYFVANGELYTLDASTNALTQIAAIPGGFDTSFLKAIGDKLYFSADDGVHGKELWVYDSKTGQASLYADLYSGHHGEMTGATAEVSGKLYFVANDGLHGNEIWVYDPATSVAQQAPGALLAAGLSDYSSLTAVAGRLYFTADDGAHGKELWVYDPASQSAHLATDILPGINGSSPSSLTALDGKLYFDATDGVHGYELWVYDPANNQAHMVADLGQFPGSNDTSPSELTVVAGKLYFVSSEPALWSYDPATDIPTKIADSSSRLFSYPLHLTEVDGKLYFSGQDFRHGAELWVFDPATNTPSLLLDLLPGGASSNPTNLTSACGKLFFGADDGVHGNALWVYDPALNSATIVQHAYAGSMAELGGKVYLNGTDAAGLAQLMVYDPATGTLSTAVDHQPLQAGYSGQHFNVVDGKLVFSIGDPNGAGQLWVYDPTTRALTPAVVNDGLGNSSNPQQVILLPGDGIDLTPIEKNPQVNPGITVTDLLAGHVTDTDNHALLGIAITGADSTHGQWQYSLDHGASWLALGSVSGQEATLLDGSAELRFVPNTDWSGRAELTIRAWDQTDGHHSGDNLVDVSHSGGHSAYSSAELHADILVTTEHAVGLTLAGGSNADHLAGSKMADVIHGNGGDDLILGNGGTDHLFGDAGNDKIHVADTTYAEVHGGVGTDTLLFDSGNLLIDLHQLADHTDGIEKIDATGGANNVVSLRAADVLHLSDDGTLAIFGTSSNVVQSAGEGWHAAGTQVVDGHSCNVFTATVGAQTATLLVDEHIATRQLS